MSLDYDCTAFCEKRKMKTKKDKAVTTCLIWGAMLVDIGDITEKNIKEWMFRLEMLAQMDVHIGTTNGKGWIPTQQDLEKRIGFKTNVYTTTRSKFEKKVIVMLRSHVARELKRKTQ